MESSETHNWTGFYAGANVSGGMSSGGISDHGDYFGYGSDNFSKGVVRGGIHAGYNNQRGNTVFGIEASPQDIRRYGVS